MIRHKSILSFCSIPLVLGCKHADFPKMQGGIFISSKQLSPKAVKLIFQQRAIKNIIYTTTTSSNKLPITQCLITSHTKNRQKLQTNRTVVLQTGTAKTVTSAKAWKTKFYYQREAAILQKQPTIRGKIFESYVFEGNSACIFSYKSKCRSKEEPPA